MKRILIYTLILALGIAIGYAFNELFLPPESPKKPKKVFVEKVKKQIIKDTIIVEKVVDPPPTKAPKQQKRLPKSDSIADSSLSNEETQEHKVDPKIDDTNEVIISEKMMEQRIAYLNADPIDSTDLEALLGVESDAFSNEIIIEFWQSPLELTGYILTRNKLKLFGFNPNETFTLRLSKDKKHLFLNTETLSILLEKTDQFKNLALK